jgi:hypothetical protein
VLAYSACLTDVLACLVAVTVLLDRGDGVGLAYSACMCSRLFGLHVLVLAYCSLFASRPFFSPPPLATNGSAARPNYPRELI